MMRHRVRGSFYALRPGHRRVVCRLHLASLCSVAALGLLAPQLLWTQDPPEPALLRAQAPSAKAPKPETSELFFEGYIPYGTFKFAGGETVSTIFYGGVEYDEHNLGTYVNRVSRILDFPPKLVHARLTYAAEILPLVLLRQPVVTDIWGNAITPARKIVPGVAIAPLGFRWMWLDGKAIRPLWTLKAGEALFTQKALSTKATYENFTINSALGMQARLSPRIDLRLAFEYYHMSNAYVNASNPGIDTLGPNFGIVYHLPASSRW